GKVSSVHASHSATPCRSPQVVQDLSCGVTSSWCRVKGRGGGRKNTAMTKRRRFPGFERCLKMMRSSNGSVSEEGFGWLAERATDYLPQFIAAFWDDDNAAIRPWLMELIGDATSPAALPFLLERLGDEDESIRFW